MAIKVTPQLIEQFNERYLILKNKAAVAREFGCSASTITKYLVDGYMTKAEKEKGGKKFGGYIPDINIFMFKDVEDWGSLCGLSEEELIELKELEKEV